MIGKIIYFDGPDGVGKTTQVQLVMNELRQAGHTVHATRTLGGTEVGEKLREILLSDLPRPAESDLHIALAIEHAQALDTAARRQKGEIVLIDRSPLSIIGYQVYGSGLAPTLGYAAVEEIFDLVKPDLIILYQAPQDLLEKRRDARHKQSDYFEKKPIDYHLRVSQGFEEAARKYRATVIDASVSVDHVFASTMKLVHEVLPRPV